MDILSLPINIIIGNIISFFASIALIISCIVNDKREAYKYQVIEALILTTMLIAAARNYLVMNERLSSKLAIMFIIITLIICPIINTMGLIGLLPMIGIIQLTICNYYLKTIKWIKVAFIVNVLIYAVYFIGIYDIVSCLTQVITAIIGFISLFKLIKEKNKENIV